MTIRDTDISDQEAEGFVSGLVATKPNHIKYHIQPGVSYIFYPAENHALYLWT